MDYIWHYHSPLGGITLASNGEALSGLWFDGQKHFGDGLDPLHEEKKLPVFDQPCRWLDIYFSGKNPGFTPMLDKRTTPFRRAIWDILLTIPYGETMPYGAIAKHYAVLNGLKRMSAQAVGNAVAHNTISIIIPCHRVLSYDGCLTGYAAGTGKKRKLLELEQYAKASGKGCAPLTRMCEPFSAN